MKKIKLAALLCFLGVKCASVAFADEPKKGAFVDTGNTGRSVMAEAIDDQLIAQRHARIAAWAKAFDTVKRDGVVDRAYAYYFGQK